MKRRTKIVLSILIAALVLAAIGFGFYMKQVSDYQNTVKNMVVSDVDTSSLPDGIYTGSCDVGFIRAKVAVTVQDGQIFQVELLEHDNGRGTPAESIINSVTREQSLTVDTVSGATNSSKVILKAIENALTGAAS